MSAEVHVGDVGTIFELTFKDENDQVVDISGASVRHVYFKKPDGTVVTQTPTFTTDGTDGKARYVTIANDLNLQGVWEIQGYVELASGKFSSSRTSFIVQGNLA